MVAERKGGETETMKLIIEKLPDLRALYIRQIRLLLSAEEQMVRELPRMIELATDLQVKEGIQSHLQETETQVARLRDILNHIAGEAEPLKCNVVAALFAEAEDMAEDSSHDEVRDAALIASMQRIEHYEMAAYGSVRHFARALGRDGEAEALDQTIHEESHADHLLAGIAYRVNPSAKRAA